MSDEDATTCKWCRSRLAEFVLDELPDDEGARVMAHLATGCEACNRDLAEVVAEWTAAAHAVPPQLPSFRVERELMARINGKTPEKVALVPREAVAAGRDVRGEGTSRRWYVAALAASLIGVATWVVWRGANSESGDAAAYQARLQQRIDQAEQAQHLAAIPELDFKYVRNEPARQHVHGHIVGDTASNQWHVYTFNLPELASDRRYLMWLVTKDGEFLEAGELRPDAKGTASKLVDLPTERSNLVSIAISNEPAEGKPEPANDIFVKAELP